MESKINIIKIKCKECEEAKDGQCMPHALVDEVSLITLTELQPRKMLSGLPKDSTNHG